MRTITKNIYSFDELNKKAQEKAIENYRCGMDFPFENDNINSIEAIADGCKWTAHWDSYDGVSYNVWFTLNEYNADAILMLTGKRAMAYIYNHYINPNTKAKTYWLNHCIYADGRKNWKRKSRITYTLDDCPFTGYCMDDAFADAWNEWKRNFNNDFSTVEGFIRAVGNKLGSYWTTDNEWLMSDECIAETLEVNGYEFTEDGSHYYG